MGLKDIWENHPVRVLTAAALGTATAATGLTLHFTGARYDSAEERHTSELASQKLGYERQIDRLEADLAGIERGTGADVLDVSGMTVTEAEAQKLPRRLEFVERDKFFTMRASEGWRRTQTSELTLLAETIGRSEAEIVAAFAEQQEREPADVRRMLTVAPVHVWRKGAGHRVDGVQDLAKIWPQIIVQRFPHAAFDRLLGPQTDEDEESLAGLSRFYRGDSTGLLLAQNLQFEVAIQGSSVESSLQTIEKSGNVVYARIQSVLTGARVDGRKRGRYFWIRELILLSTTDDLYIVKTFDPRPDLRGGSNFAWITRWLASFKVVTRPA